MKSKKFVLAGVLLLAITMVLLPLSGCKNDSVPATMCRFWRFKFFALKKINFFLDTIIC